MSNLRRKHEDEKKMSKYQADIKFTKIQETFNEYYSLLEESNNNNHDNNHTYHLLHNKVR